MNQAQPMTKTQESNVLQGAVAAAMLKANKDHQATGATATFSNVIPSVIPRTDLLNQDVIFLAHTLDREAETIQYWDMKKGSKPTTVGTAYYKSTRPVKDPQKVTQMVQTFSKEFGTKEVILRERLVKSSMDRAEDGNVNSESIEDFKARFRNAIEKMLAEL